MDNILSDKYIFDSFNPNALAQQIATNAKKRRLELNITQKELAQKSQVSLGSIKRFETSAEISLRNLLLIAVALNATHEFKSLFSQQQFQSIDELTEAKKNKDRKRARKKMIIAPEKLSIFLNNSHIGNLAITPNNLAAFEYTPEYLNNGVSISPFHTPLQSGVFIAKPEPFFGLFGIFNDSLPDDWGKLLTDRLLKKHDINPSLINNIQRLSLVGKNGIGALNYLPQWELSKTSGKIDLDIIAQEVKNILNNSETDIETLYREGGSSGGARPKVFYKYDNTQWIVKFKAGIDPTDIGKLEYDYSITARKCGIIMPQTKLFNGKYFGVKRFDIGEKGKFLIHSASGLLYTSFRLPSLDYIDLIKATLALTQSMEEALKIFRQMVFNIFTYNKDDHSKNFSFILKGKQWEVSPAYDLVFSDGFNGQHSTTVNGKGNPDLEDIMEVAKQTGIPLKKASTIMDEVKKNTSELIKQLQFKKLI